MHGDALTTEANSVEQQTQVDCRDHFGPTERGSRLLAGLPFIDLTEWRNDRSPSRHPIRFAGPFSRAQVRAAEVAEAEAAPGMHQMRE